MGVVISSEITYLDLIIGPEVIIRNSIQGSLWNRWDLHFHTPSSSFDYRNKSVTNQQIISQLLKEQIKVVAITDHHVIDIDRIKQLQKLGGEEITILPGIELRDEHGGEPIHYICIFPEDSDLENIWTTFQGKLGLTPKNIVEKGGDEKVYVQIGEAAPLTRELGGVISIHAGAKSNSIENISNREQFQQRLKYDITKEYVDLLEIGQLKDIDRHLDIIFPATGLDKPLIICSDNHDVNDYQIKVPLWLKADPTFRGLLMVLHEPRSRVFIGDQPEQFRRIEQNSTKYIKSITIRRKEDAPESESWFDNTIVFNPDLVAIIGNKGSGKSALADTLGLLGSTKNWEWFSFLSDERFCHLTAGHADHYEATLEWASGEKTTRCLVDEIKPEEVERIKYLPQDHVERICNEIVGIGEERFEKELESVIFSHVPEVQRLGNRTFDKLVQFKTGEKQNRIDSIIKQLQEVCRERAALELEDDPKVKRELTEKIKQRRIELEAHDRIKLEEVPNPSLKNGEDEAGSSLLKSLQTKEEAKKKVVDGIATTEEILRNSERRLAISNRLFEKIENFKKEFDAFKNSLEEEAIEVGLKAEDLITFSSDLQPIQKIKEEAINTIKTKNALLNE